MKNDNNSNAIDKLTDIEDKLSCIISAIAYLDIKGAYFDESDVIGFNMILRDLKNNVGEVKQLLNLNLNKI